MAGPAQDAINAVSKGDNRRGEQPDPGQAGDLHDVRPAGGYEVPGHLSGRPVKTDGVRRPQIEQG